MNKMKFLLTFLLLFSIPGDHFGQSKPIPSVRQIDGSPIREKPVTRPPLPQKNVVPWTCDLLIVGGTVVTMDKDRRLIENGAVAIKDGKIAMVGKRAAVTYRLTAKQTIN